MSSTLLLVVLFWVVFLPKARKLVSANSLLRLTCIPWASHTRCLCRGEDVLGIAVSLVGLLRGLWPRPMCFHQTRVFLSSDQGGFYPLYCPCSYLFPLPPHFVDFLWAFWDTRTTAVSCLAILKIFCILYTLIECWFTMRTVIKIVDVVLWTV